MRPKFLASAAVISLAFMPAAFAQTAAPESQAPDAAAPAMSGPAAEAMPRHHHRMANPADASDSATWAHQPGTGLSGPASDHASNIDGNDTHSDIAPHFPEPPAGMDAWGYLRAADAALSRHRTGEAQQALEMAETRLLDRSTLAGTERQPNQGPIVTEVSQARQALGHGDVGGAHTAIQSALAGQPR